VQTRPRIAALRNVATRLRIDSVRATSEAGSGHPTSCASAAEIVSALFFAEMCYDPRNPQNPDNDRFVLSKGHAAPVLYAAWAEVGFLKRDELLTLRRLDSIWKDIRRRDCRLWTWPRDRSVKGSAQRSGSH
jgi:transketolase